MPVEALVGEGGAPTAGVDAAAVGAPAAAEAVIKISLRSVFLLGGAANQILSGADDRGGGFNALDSPRGVAISFEDTRFYGLFRQFDHIKSRLSLLEVGR